MKKKKTKTIYKTPRWSCNTENTLAYNDFCFYNATEDGATIPLRYIMEAVQVQCKLIAEGRAV